MKWISTIKKIGKKAIDIQDGMIILFGEDTNKDLAEVSIIQKFDEDTPIKNFVFKKGDTVTIDGQTYIAEHVGPMVGSNMKALAHATMIFDQPIPKSPLANSIYFALTDNESFPKFKVNDEIVYEHI